MFPLGLRGLRSVPAQKGHRRGGGREQRERQRVTGRRAEEEEEEQQRRSCQQPDGPGRPGQQPEQPEEEIQLLFQSSSCRSQSRGWDLQEAEEEELQDDAVNASLSIR